MPRCDSFKANDDIQLMAKKGNKICPSGIAWAKRTFDRYPSAYANMAASRYCKDPKYGRKKKKK